MKKRDGGSASNPNEWLNTYADMVTLLMCFFVLLYATSSTDAAKWDAIVESLNPDARPMIPAESGIIDPESSLVDTSTPGEDTAEDKDFNDLYEQLQQYIDEQGLTDSVELYRGDEFTFITFKNNVFFDGDSFSLRWEGVELLDFLGGALDGLNSQVQQVRIMGHTSQANDYQHNYIETDRFLASNRATTVLVYLQNLNVIDAGKYVSEGYGQEWPIAPFDTEENRSKNRRVEIMISKTDSVSMALSDVYSLMGVGDYTGAVPQPAVETPPTAPATTD